MPLQESHPPHDRPPETGRLSTYFDTPERTSEDDVRAAVDVLAGTRVVTDLLEAYPGPTVLLDENRQIVAFNRKCMPYFADRPASSVYGLRLGEAIACLHADAMDAGCGTSLFCRDCGAGVAIRTATHERRPTSLECRITAAQRGKQVALDLRVQTSAIEVAGMRLVVAAIQDIGDEKRRQAFELIFFHDVLNTASTISQIARLMNVVTEPKRVRELTASLVRSSSQLLDEIQAQRDLVNAERGELIVDPRPVSATGLLVSVREMYAATQLADGKPIVLDELPPDALVDTDAVQAIRCLGNLVKNALEASRRGSRVRLSGDVRAASVAFHVHNAGVMSDRVQRQLFKRSFSTKGARGRGIGTYSVKLIVEQYLAGTVRFASDPERETVFTIELPRAASPDGPAAISTLS